MANNLGWLQWCWWWTKLFQLHLRSRWMRSPRWDHTSVCNSNNRTPTSRRMCSMVRARIRRNPRPSTLGPSILQIWRTWPRAQSNRWHSLGSSRLGRTLSSTSRRHRSSRHNSLDRKEGNRECCKPLKEHHSRKTHHWMDRTAHIHQMVYRCFCSHHRSTSHRDQSSHKYCHLHHRSKHLEKFHHHYQKVCHQRWSLFDLHLHLLCHLLIRGYRGWKRRKECRKFHARIMVDSWKP